MSEHPDLARVRDIALAMPGAAEKLSHGTPMFYIEKGKSFAWFSEVSHNTGHRAVLVKTSGEEEQTMLIEEQPELYFKPAYLGPSGWIALRLDSPDTDWDHVADRIAQSWEMVAPRRLLEAGGR